MPCAGRITWYDGQGGKRWTRSDARIADRDMPALIEPLFDGTLEPQVRKISDGVTVVAAPAAMDGKAVAVLQLHMLCDRTHTEPRVLAEVMSAAAPLIDCLARELSQLGKKRVQAATLAERTEELEWLFALSESLHSNSNDPKAIKQLLGAAAERMKCSFGAVLVPEHGIDCTYASLVHIDRQAEGAFERCRPYFMNYVQRRRQPLIANKVLDGTHMPPFKLLVVPIEPKERLLGFIAFLKQPTLPNFGRRQLFLARHIGHQIGTLLESQYDLATGLLTRSAFEEDVRRLLGPDKSRPNSLLYFNIDRLRGINDTLGFDIGDEAIVRIADLLRPPALPENSIACRLGSDSFVAFLPDYDADQASVRADAIVGIAAKSSV